MSGLTPDQLRRIGELHRETLPDYWRRFYRERGMPFTEADIEELKAMDEARWPKLAQRDREEGRYS